MFGRDSDHIRSDRNGSVPTISKCSSIPELVTILDNSGKQLRLSSAEIDHLLREVVVDKTRGSDRCSGDKAASSPNRPSSAQLRKRNNEGKIRNIGGSDRVLMSSKMPVHRISGGSLPVNALNSDTFHLMHEFSPTNISYHCQNILALWHDYKNIRKNIKSVIVMTSELLEVLYCFCDSGNVPSKEVLVRYGWPSVALICMFRQLYTVLEVVAVIEGGFCKESNHAIFS